MVSCLFLSHYHVEIHTEIFRDETAQYVGFASNNSFVVVMGSGRNNKEYTRLCTPNFWSWGPARGSSMHYFLYFCVISHNRKEKKNQEMKLTFTHWETFFSTSWTSGKGIRMFLGLGHGFRCTVWFPSCSKGTTLGSSQVTTRYRSSSLPFNKYTASAWKNSVNYFIWSCFKDTEKHRKYNDVLTTWVSRW